jgi:predicted RNA binding protein YcfA (HicA-like mRNA interferase family)
MKTPRNISAKELLKMLTRCGYEVTRQKGSHIRLTVLTAQGERHVTVPNHDPLSLGTLSSILSDVSEHLGVAKEDLLNKL